MKKIKVTQEEWDKLSNDFADRQAGNTSSLSEAMDNITRFMNKYKIIK